MNQTDQDILVSICCLTYNQVEWIRKSLDGILLQKTNFKYEVIIHDDCSNDGTRDIVIEYKSRYPDLIHLILPEENQYQLGKDMFDKCIQEAKGKYIAWCEGDDEWTNSNKLQLQFDYLESHSQCSLVYTNVDIYIESEDRVEKNALTSGFIKPPKSFKEHLLNAGHLAPLTWLFRKDCYVHNTKRDVDWSYSIALDLFANGEVHFLNITTALYRIFNNSVSHSETIGGLLQFGKGIIEIKEKYFLRYRNLLTEGEIQQIRFKSFEKYLPSAICLDDEEFLERAISAAKFVGNKTLPLIVKVRDILLLPQILKIIYKFKGRR